MSTKPKAAEVKAESVKELKDEAVKVAEEKAETSKPEGKASNAKTQKHIVQWTLHRDSKRYKAGDELELDTDTAQPLVEAGVLVASK